MNINEGENCGNSVQNNHIRDIVCMSIYFFFIIFPPAVEVIALYIFNFTKDQSSIMTMIYLPPIVAVMLSYGKEFLKSFKYFKKRFVIRIGTIILSMLLTLFITSILVMSFELQTPENEKALIESYGNADLYSCSDSFFSAVGRRSDFSENFNYIIISSVEKEIWKR